MTDTTPPPRSNDPANDGYEIRNADEARQDAKRKKDDKEHLGEEILDTIEDAIPGDSDHDGH